jgi:drug/metabolite transporter (DMT)-like permease
MQNAIGREAFESARVRSGLSRGYSIALASAAVLSTTAILIRHLTLTYHIPPLVLAFWRDMFTALLLFVVLRIRRPELSKVAARDLRFLAAYGLVLAVFNSLWTLSVAFAGASVATVLGYSSAGFSVLLGRWLLKEKLDLTKLLAVASTLGGCVLVSGVLDTTLRNASLLGILAGVLSGLGYAGYSLMGRAASRRGLNPWTTVLYTFGAAAVFLASFNLFAGGVLPGAAARPADFLWLGDALAGWGVLFLLAAGPTLIGFGLYNVSLGYLPASVANLIVTLEPVFTVAIAAAFLGERLNAVQIAGGVMILGGVALLRVHEGRREARVRGPGSRSPGVSPG